MQVVPFHRGEYCVLRVKFIFPTATHRIKMIIPDMSSHFHFNIDPFCFINMPFLESMKPVIVIS